MSYEEKFECYSSDDTKAGDPESSKASNSDKTLEVSYVGWAFLRN